MEATESYQLLIEDLHRSENPEVDMQDSVRAYGKAFLKVIEKHDGLSLRLNESFAARETINKSTRRGTGGPSYLGNLALRYVHHLRNLEIIKPYHPDAKFDSEHDSLRNEDEWEEAITGALESDRLEFDISMQDVASNIPQRYGAVQAVVGSYEERYPDGISICDLGCSLNLGLKKIMAEDPFRYINVANNPDAEIALNKRLYERVNIARADGVDKWNFIKDEAQIRWAQSCSFPFYDLDMERMAEFSRLSQLQFSEMHAIQSNLNSGVRAFLEDLEAQESRVKYDVVSAVTMLYQQPEDIIGEYAQIIDAITHDSSVVVIQDFGYLTKKGRFRPITSKWYEKNIMPYKTIVYDRANPDDGFKEWFKWTTSRCTDAEVTEHAYRKLET